MEGGNKVCMPFLVFFVGGPDRSYAQILPKGSMMNGCVSLVVLRIASKVKVRLNSII